MTLHQSQCKRKPIPTLSVILETPNPNTKKFLTLLHKYFSLCQQVLSPWIHQGYIRGVTFHTWFLTLPDLLVSTLTISPIYPHLNPMFQNFSEGANTPQCVTASLQILAHQKSKDSSLTDFSSDSTFSIPAWITFHHPCFRPWHSVCRYSY